MKITISLPIEVPEEELQKAIDKELEGEDFVKVVRCKDCKHYEVIPTIYGTDYVCTAQGCMKVSKHCNDFCSLGELNDCNDNAND